MRCNRIEQSLHLAQQLAHRQRELSALSSELEDERKMRESLAAQLSAAQRQLERVKQPYNYLVRQRGHRRYLARYSRDGRLQVQQLQDKDAALSTAQNAVQRLQRDLECALCRPSWLRGG